MIEVSDLTYVPDLFRRNEHINIVLVLQSKEEILLEKIEFIPKKFFEILDCMAFSKESIKAIRVANQILMDCKLSPEEIIEVDVKLKLNIPTDLDSINLEVKGHTSKGPIEIIKKRIYEDKSDAEIELDMKIISPEDKRVKVGELVTYCIKIIPRTSIEGTITIENAFPTFASVVKDRSDRDLQVDETHRSIIIKKEKILANEMIEKYITIKVKRPFNFRLTPALKVPEMRIFRIIKEHAITTRKIEGTYYVAKIEDLKNAMPRTMPDTFYMENPLQEEIADEAIKYIKQGYNVIIYGESGVGKTKTFIPITKRLLREEKDIIVIDRLEKTKIMEYPYSIKLIDDLRAKELTEDTLKELRNTIITMLDHEYEKICELIIDIEKYFKVIQIRREKIPSEFILRLFIFHLNKLGYTPERNQIKKIIEKSEGSPAYIMAVIDEIEREKPKDISKFIKEIPAGFSNLIARTITLTLKSKADYLLLTSIMSWLDPPDKTVICEEHIFQMMSLIEDLTKTKISDEILIIRTFLRELKPFYIAKHNQWQNVIYQLLIESDTSIITETKYKNIIERKTLELKRYMQNIENMMWKAYMNTLSSTQNAEALTILLSSYALTVNVYKNPNIIIKIIKKMLNKLDINSIRVLACGLSNIILGFAESTNPERSILFLEELQRLADEQRDIEVYRWLANGLNNIILDFVMIADLREATQFLEELQRLADEQRDIEIYKALARGLNNIIFGFAEIGNIERATSFLKELQRLAGEQRDIEIYRASASGLNNIILGFARAANPEGAASFLEELRELANRQKDMEIYRWLASGLNNIILGFARAANPEGAASFLEELRELANRQKDMEIYRWLAKGLNNTISGFARAASPKEATLLLKELRKLTDERKDIEVYRTLAKGLNNIISGFAEVGNPKEAIPFLRELQELAKQRKDTEIYRELAKGLTNIISGFIKTVNLEEAISFLEELQKLADKREDVEVYKVLAKGLSNMIGYFAMTLNSDSAVLYLNELEKIIKSHIIDLDFLNTYFEALGKCCIATVLEDFLFREIFRKFSTLLARIFIPEFIDIYIIVINECAKRNRRLGHWLYLVGLGVTLRGVRLYGYNNAFHDMWFNFLEFLRDNICHFGCRAFLKNKEYYIKLFNVHNKNDLAEFIEILAKACKGEDFDNLLKNLNDRLFAQLIMFRRCLKNI